jgi:hypothetical protein
MATARVQFAIQGCYDDGAGTRSIEAYPIQADEIPAAERVRNGDPGGYLQLIIDNQDVVDMFALGSIIELTITNPGFTAARKAAAATITGMPPTPSPGVAAAVETQRHRRRRKSS